jgi:hypothetical protein
MSSRDKRIYDDQLLTRYLLGTLPTEEAELLDELSIADDETAVRIQSAENDLVDAYARGDVRGTDLENFEAFYLTSARRREKVEVAQALFALESRAVPEPARMPSAVATPRAGHAAGGGFRFPRLAFAWGFACTAVVLLIVGGYLLLENGRLRRQMNDAQAQRAAIEQRRQQLQKELDDQRSASAESLEPQANSRTPKTFALLLPPPTRGVARVPTVSMPAGTDIVVLLLALETADFPAYHATLKDPAGNKALWSSGKLEAESLSERKVISISFAASLLKQQNYLVDLTGLPARGTPELIGSYSFRVAVR